ncbi:MAG: PAS domain S-box protein, partial [Planctomycetia bacterium]|nr:PAS domain S-box protein [Planctomycetia bacterium]
MTPSFNPPALPPAARATPERSLAQLRAIVSNMADGLVVADTAGNLLDWNPAALRMHGYPSVEEVRRHLSSFADLFVLSVPGGPPLPFSEWPMSRILRGETLSNDELQVRRTDTGQELVISYSGTLVPDPTGGPELAVLTLRNVTDQRRAEAELRASETLFRSAFENTNVAMVLTDLSHRFIRVNAAFARLFGYSQEEMLRMSMPDITHPDDLAESFARRELLLSGESHFTQRKRYLHRDGRVLWGVTNVSLVRDAAGRPRLYVGQVQDVTAQKQAENELRASEGRFQAFFDATTAAMVEISPDARYLRANAAFYRMFGYSPEDLPNLTVGDIVFPEDREAVLAQYNRVGQGETTSYEADRRYRRKDGSPLWARVSVVAARDETGLPKLVTAVVIDMTERKKLEEQ